MNDGGPQGSPFFFVRAHVMEMSRSAPMQGL